MSVITSREISAKLCTVAGQKHFENLSSVYRHCNTFGSVNWKFSIGCCKVDQLAFEKKEASYHSNQTSEFNLPPNESDKAFWFSEGLNISQYKNQRVIPLGLALKQVDTYKPTKYNKKILAKNQVASQLFLIYFY